MCRAAFSSNETDRDILESLRHISRILMLALLEGTISDLSAQVTTTTTMPTQSMSTPTISDEETFADVSQQLSNLKKKLEEEKVSVR